MDSPLKISVIVLTAVATVGIGIGGAKLYEISSQANVLNADSQESDTGSLSYETRIAKGDERMAQEDFEEAKKEYEFATHLEPKTAEGFLKLGTAELALHQTDTALVSLRTAYELSPNADTAAELAHVLMIQSQWEEAEKILSSVQESTQTLLYEKALYNVLQNNLETAKQEFTAALENNGALDPNTLQNYLNSFQTYEAAQGAEPLYLQALLCKALVDAKEYQLTIHLSKQVLNQKNDYRDVWMILGYAEFKLELHADAEEAFRQAKKIDSLKPEVHYFLGTVLLKQEKYSEAVDELQLALLYNFSPAEEAYKKIAEAHEAKEAWTDAVAAYEALLNLNPSAVELFEKPVELCLIKLQDLSRAQTLAERAVSSFPSTALSHTLLAKVKLSQGEVDLASSEIDTAFQIDSNFALAHYTAGKIRSAQNNKDGALWEFKKTFELTNEDDPLHKEAAEAYNALITEKNP